jgi:hypothetical protein
LMVAHRACSQSIITLSQADWLNFRLHCRSDADGTVLSLSMSW